ncbi:hypothetical protein [Brevundimonas sp.]|uniref:hypothetical protein n=1 Tax=Brevundimonas sp. TaxID=1871086 RepID=UPI002ED9ED23
MALLLVIGTSVGVSASKVQDEDWWVLSAGDAAGNVYLVDGIPKLEMGAAVSYHTHFFYKVSVNGVRSAQIEYYVNCEEQTIREARYVDYDDRREPIYSGDNYDVNSAYKPRAGTIGDELIMFSCASEDERLQKYPRIDMGADKWALGESLLSVSAVSS